MSRPTRCVWFAVGLLNLALAAGCGSAVRRDAEARRPPETTSLSAAAENLSVMTAPLAPPPTPGTSDAVENAVSASAAEKAKEAPFRGVQEELARQRSSAEPGPVDRSNRAEDYGWLVGELHYVHVRNVWQLRYAAADEEDRYGGSVTLAGELNGLQNGRKVRVEGRLQDPDSHEPSPVYHVRRVDLLEVR